MILTIEQGSAVDDEALPDIKPRSPVAVLDREKYAGQPETFTASQVAPVVGMSVAFITRVTGKRAGLTVMDVLSLLDQDAYGETLVRRSQVLDHLVAASQEEAGPVVDVSNDVAVIHGDALATIRRLPAGSVSCVVTSPPYWAMRLYPDPHLVRWADGEVCPYGHEQTPEAYIRHSVEILAALRPTLRPTGSVWWNVMDTYNTRTQIRTNAAETLRAMQGHDRRRWSEHACRRYSAGHAYLKDGEQCTIPSRLAERAARIGYHVKSIITWGKGSTTPEPQDSRVSRSAECVLHLTPSRTPGFDKTAYRTLPTSLGGRDPRAELDRLTDVWTIGTSAGRSGHGAQFPLALPGRCIGLSTVVGDLVVDPFAGAGTTGVAARMLGRRFLGIETAGQFAAQAGRSVAAVEPALFGPANLT